jgi:CubicO group peptidase (beta-lactamase class C family)
VKAVLRCAVPALLLAGCAQQPEPPPAAPAATLQELDARIGKSLADAKIPGASVAVIEGGKVVWAKGYGYADLARKTPVTPDTVFRAGSISKSFTAIGVVMLVEEGKLDLDAPLRSLMPEVRFENPWEATDPVRLVHVIEHTAGFDDLAFEDFLHEGRDVPTARAVEINGPYRSRWRPGTMMSYSNPGPVIAGLAIEKAGGLPFEDFMAGRLLQPLGMTGARWTMDPTIAPRMSKSYRDPEGTEERFVEIIDRPSGSLNVTPTELARLPLLMLGRGSLDGRTYFSAASADRIERPATTDAARAGFAVGYGLGNYTQKGGKAVWHGHDGAIDGFLAMSRYAPALDAGFVLMLNMDSPAAEDIADAIRGYLERAAPAVVPTGRPLRADEIAAFGGFYRTDTPRNQILAPLEAFSFTRVRADGEGLRIGERRFVAVGEGLFQRVGGPGPELSFMRSPGGTVMTGIDDRGRKRPLPEVAAKFGWLGILLLTVSISLGHAVFWMIAAARGRLAARGGLSIRLMPWLAVMSVVVTLAALLVSSGGGIDRLGTASWSNLTLLGATLVMPVLGIAALWRAWRGSPAAPRAVRALAWASGIVVTSLALFLAGYGWIGVRLWTAG